VRCECAVYEQDDVLGGTMAACRSACACTIKAVALARTVERGRAH